VRSVPLLEKIRSRTARAGVVGLGYVGLPLAVEFARAGLTTVGIDLDRQKVDTIADHQAFDFGLVVEAASLVVDTRNATRGGAHVFKLGAPKTSGIRTLESALSEV
jgi:UDP-N-acetyl-D-mannosaminuronate dehydrogenase